MIKRTMFSSWVSLMANPKMNLEISRNFKNLNSKLESLISSYDDKTIESWHCEKCGHVQGNPIKYKCKNKPALLGWENLCNKCGEFHE